MAQDNIEALVKSRNQDLFDPEFTGDIDPYELFDRWLELAWEKEQFNANAMSLATLDEDGLPNIRVVLLKEREADGFTFYTNTNSKKGQELNKHPKAALGFYWRTLNWQVRVRGDVKPVAADRADAYHTSRPRGSQIGAHASHQSQPLSSRQELIDRVEELTQHYEGQDVPRPDHWSGYTVMPTEIEFWCDGEFRLHDRVRFTWSSDGAWQHQRLNP
ncbi:pyridoxamine 5'-phosphate oxidase [Maritalea mediterranea]|uniref:Pyridoxine/pyridoxamine 5'-phosphate oxidase n=1 Tax=Maritalea mediterranea TaxID=2909667 RepID=A0ABS9E7Z4_9HYPH|nr:pyridoxamine 5'-phosphate oxidase [Maritalea mediterranea]MCF4097890.1 pyridoxamine 5'-phosphate oxidase [Maritalea mediterranea]